MRGIHRLTDRTVKGSLPPGRHADGGCLYLRVKEGGSKSFAFMSDLTIDGQKRRIQMGLGGYPTTSLAAAREKALDLRARIKEPVIKLRLERGASLREAVELEERRAAEAAIQLAPTFGDFSKEWLDANLDNMTSNLKARQQWYSTLAAYAGPINSKPVDEIDFEDVLACLQPIWSTKHETARRVQQRIFRILAAAKVYGHRTGDNPAQWSGNLDLALPLLKRVKGHHAAMPYADLPDYFEKLTNKKTTASLALQFIILTASRSGEGRGALWSEIDLDQALWTLPAERMKARKDHIVPLSKKALTILKRMKEGNKSTFVFPSTGSGGHLTEASLRKLMKTTGAGEFTIHGFRSTFRDWAGNETDFPRELAEEALAHQLGSVEAAYRRGKAVEKRRELMEAWSKSMER